MRLTTALLFAVKRDANYADFTLEIRFHGHDEFRTEFSEVENLAPRWISSVIIIFTMYLFTTAPFRSVSDRSQLSTSCHQQNKHATPSPDLVDK